MKFKPQQCYNLIKTLLQTENESKLGFELWQRFADFARFFCAFALNSNHQFSNLLNNIDINPDVDDPGIYMLPKVDYWTLKPSKDVKLYKKTSKKTIPLGNKPRNLSVFFKKFIKKNQIENYHPYPIRLREEDLIKYLKYITKIKKAEEKFGKKKN